MSDRDKDPEEALSPNGLELGDDEFEENPEEGFEGEGEPEESDEDEGRPPVGAPSGRRFGLGRGGQRTEDSGHRVTGSVRESHERVHVDDRASGIYALLAAAVLIGILAIAFAGNYVPQGAEPTAPPLVVPTFNGTLPPSAGPSVSVAPSESPVAPSESPVATPTAASSATPSPVASPSAT
jgi:hypothetical protein